MRKICLFAILFLLASCGRKNEVVSDTNRMYLQSPADIIEIPELPAQEAPVQVEIYNSWRTTARINGNELTFIHEILGYAEQTLTSDIERYVRITIKNEAGEIIQQIDDLVQGWHGDFPYDRLGIRFADFNFDGYLDMYLLLAESAGLARWDWIYYWLWDTEAEQFVKNEQLINLLFNMGCWAGLYVYCGEEDLVVVSFRGGSWIQFRHYYEYAGGEFVRVAEALDENLIDENDLQFRRITRTDLRTGEVTIRIIEPWQFVYAGLLRKYAEKPSPCEFTPDIWRHFVLYDIDKDGIPELMIFYSQAGFWSEGFYTWRNGEAVPIDGGFFIYYYRAFPTPCGSPGIILANTLRHPDDFDHVSFIRKIIDGDRLVTEISLVKKFEDRIWQEETEWFIEGEAAEWLINGEAVSEGEFTRVYNEIFRDRYGNDESKRHLATLMPSTITDVTIQEVVLGWQPE